MMDRVRPDVLSVSPHDLINIIVACEDRAAKPRPLLQRQFVINIHKAPGIILRIPQPRDRDRHRPAP